MAGKGIRKSKDIIVFDCIGYSLVALFGLICFIPFWLVFISSFADETSLLRDGFQLWPQAFSLDAYRWVFENPLRIFIAYRNTIAVTVIGTFLTVFLSVMTGYVLSRPNFPWKNGFSFFFFFTTLFNGGLVPWYILCTQYLQFKNHYYAMILPMMFSVWNMLIAKNFMRSLPYEISESAKVDGAGEMYIFLKLILPISKPLLATLALFSALGFWNDWYNCMLFISDENKQNLQYFLQDMLGSVDALKSMVSSGDLSAVAHQVIPEQSMKMAMTCVVIGPIIFLYPIIQKNFIKGLTIGAVKG
jgi:putative aldouronate transport system permease protein